MMQVVESNSCHKQYFSKAMDLNQNL